MQRYIKILCIFFIAMLLLAACGKQEPAEDSVAAPADTEGTLAVTENAVTDSTDGVTPTEAGEEQPDYSIRYPEAVVELPSSDETAVALTEKQTATRIATVDAQSVSVYEGGFIYTAQDGLRGIISLDGNDDTGAKYAYCQAEEMYFRVMDEAVTDISDVSAMNNVGLVNSRGQELIPQKYASIDVLNSRFARVCEVTGTSSTREGALVYMSASNEMFAGLAGPSDEDYFFTGIWYIYDLASGTKVPGATGTQAYVSTAHGNYVTYVTDDQDQFTVHGDGKALPQGASILSNDEYGFYKYNSYLYDSQDNKLFKLTNTDGYTVSGTLGDYLYASKYENGASSYVLMDYEGTVISAEFTDLPNVQGNLIKTEDPETNRVNYCDFQNKTVFSAGADEEVTFSDYARKCFFVATDTKLTVYDVNGKKIASVTAGEIRDAIFSYYVVTEDYDHHYLCLSTGAFMTTDADDIGPWLLKAQSENSTYKVLDAISGAVLLDGIKEPDATYTRTHTYITCENEAGELEIYQVK